MWASSNTPNNSVVERSEHSFGTPIWQMFYLLMEEEDKDTFDNMVEVLRNTLKAYAQHKLLKILDDKYLKHDFYL